MSRKDIKKLLIVCDAFDPEKDKKGKKLISGVKTHIINISKAIEKEGVKVLLLHPYTRYRRKRMYKTFVTPLDKHFEFVVNPFLPTAQYIKRNKPDAIFLSTPEAPLGMATRQVAKVTPNITKHKEIPYTASYHTNNDIYFKERISQISGGTINVNGDIINKLTRNVYKDSFKVVVPTKTIESKINSIGITNTVVWPRGVDSEMFRMPKEGEKSPYKDLKWYKKENKPILLYFGRVSPEKRIEEFLDIKTTKYHKVVIGDGPHFPILKSKYKKDEDVHFLGAKFGEELAKFVRFSDLLVFTSKFDTFGNVITEAGASGVPCVAYDTQGPHDVIKEGMGIKVGVDDDISKAIPLALELDRQRCRDITIENYSWEKSAKILLSNLKKINWK